MQRIFIDMCVQFIHAFLGKMLFDPQNKNFVNVNGQNFQKMLKIMYIWVRNLFVNLFSPFLVFLWFWEDLNKTIMKHAGAELCQAQVQFS